MLTSTARENNRRIARNTVILYSRMFLMLVIGLFTSRVILQTLGVEDYGIYNAIGGFVALFGIISGTLTNSINRFLTFEIGRGDKDRLIQVFSTSLNVMVILSVIIIILGVTVGMWFLNTQMVIPAGRESAANWVLVCSILSFVINLLNVPYNAAIVAHEKMAVFAYISFIEVVLKLLIVYALYIIPFDKLKVYVVLFLLLALLIRLLYGAYCVSRFEECKYRFTHNRHLLRQMVSFAGWNFFAAGAGMLNNSGVNVMMNIFFGVTVNAARGIATQINTYVCLFVNNFMMALNPQITKSYAQGEYAYMHSLVCRGARFSYFLVLLFVIPMCIETRQLLHLWLGIVPDYAVPFVQLTLISSAIYVLSNTIITSIHATGNIRCFMLIVGSVEILNFPLTYIAFRMGASPLVAYYIYLAVYVILTFLRFYLTKSLIHMPTMMFVRDVWLRVLIVTILAAALPVALRILMPVETFLRFVLICLTSLAATATVVWFMGIDKVERIAVRRMIGKLNLIR